MDSLRHRTNGRCWEFASGGRWHRRWRTGARSWRESRRRRRSCPSCRRRGCRRPRRSTTRYTGRTGRRASSATHSVRTCSSACRFPTDAVVYRMTNANAHRPTRKAPSTPATLSKQHSTLLPQTATMSTDSIVKCRNKLNMFNLFRHCRKDEISFDIVAETGNIVAKNGNNVEATFNTVERIVQLVAFDNVASTLLLVWTGLNTLLLYQWPAAWHVAEWHGVHTVLLATHTFSLSTNGLSHAVCIS